MFGKLALLVACLGLVILTAMPALATDKVEAELKLKEAEVVVRQIMLAPDSNIPSDLVRKARAVVIFPGMVKAGFIVGGQYGTGVVIARRPDGVFGAPAFYSMGGVSAGLQIGAQAVDVIMLVMNKKGLDGILKNKVKFGADIGVAAGPVGRRAEAGVTGADLYADVYSYSRAKGAFAGISLEGAGLEYDAETTKVVYGRALTASEILGKDEVAAPASAAPLINALNSLGK
ncbi:MAG: lipid-binding SYLF domain-containing protein [Desulfarculus sp.]|nr:lipid-binding SYLF domain-containing protein [Desulfarculus sp.]